VLFAIALGNLVLLLIANKKFHNFFSQTALSAYFCNFTIRDPSLCVWDHFERHPTPFRRLSSFISMSTFFEKWQQQKSRMHQLSWVVPVALSLPKSHDESLIED
jgi:uncharacterized membrane protein